MKKSLRDVKSVLVLGIENNIVLPVIRALGRLMPHAKIFTQSPISNGRPAWASSKYIADHYYFHTTGDSDNLREVIACIERTQADIIIPANEDYVRWVSKNKDTINKHTLVPPLPSPTQFDQLVPKHKLNEFLIDHNLPHANNYRLDDPILHNWNIEVTHLILKPIRGSSGTGMKKISSIKELHETIQNLDPEKYFLQEEIDGEIMDCSLLAIDGEIKAWSIKKNLAKVGYNFSTAMEFIEHNEIYKTTCKLVELSGYSGLANLDYCLDKKDGQPKPIDFNARFWVSLLGAKAAGIDYTELYCLAAFGHSISRREYNKCIYLMGKSAMNHYRKKVLSPFSKHSSTCIHTDLWYRVTDPKPEILQLIRNRYRSGVT